MSYLMEQLSDECIIRKNNFAKVKENMVAIYNKKEPFWYVNQALLDQTVLEDAEPKVFIENFCKGFGWVPLFDKHGDIVALSFFGSKYGSEEDLFVAIQDQVESMEIDMRGETEDWTWSIKFSTGLKRLPRINVEGIPR